MPFFKYFSIRNCKCHTVVRILGIILPILLLCFSAPAMAGDPVGGTSGIFIYNLDAQSFSVVWQVDTQSTCTIKLYDNINGPNPLIEGTDYNATSKTNNSTLAQQRGVMQVDVSGLTGVNTYFLQTVSQDNAGTHEYPPLGSLIEINTVQEITTEQPYSNGIIELALYDKNGTGNPEQSDGVVAIIDAGGISPVSSFTYSGWPESQGGMYIVYIDLGNVRTNTAYTDWTASPQNHSIKIMCFGGLVPEVGLGQRIIETTYPSGNINNDYYECLSFYGINDTDGCARGYTEQIVIYPNQPPNFNLNASYSVNKNATLTIDICATDPEGDPVVGFTLSNEPSGMDITTDANCATITWTPTACGIFENIQVSVSDGTSANPKTFKVDILQCPPYKPNASIEPQSPVTTENLTCNATDNGDPDGDAITLIYKWYEENSPGTVLSTTYTLDSSDTVKDEKYYCEVIARDVHGDSEAETAGPVTVQNSAPSAPGNVGVAPLEPLSDQNLTCTVGIASEDPDEETVYYTYQWKCSNCNDKVVALNGPKTDNFDTLSSDETSRGQNWWCEVRATDNIAQSAVVQSNTVNIQNLAPLAPGSVSITTSTPIKTGDSLTCEIGEPSTDPDEDPVKYVFTWKCPGKDSIQRDAKTGPSDTLSSGNTTKGDEWSCEVWAQDDFGGKSSTVTTSAVTVENSPPTGLSVNVTPDPAYVNNNLTCTASGVTDADGDTISYQYIWKNGGVTVDALTKDFTAGKTTDVIQASNTSQGETWSCEVTAKDTSDAQVGPISDNVLIDNQEPVVTTDPTEDTQTWDEGGSYQIQISVSDPDDNEFTLVIDTNHVDPGDPNVSAWIAFDDVNYILTADPPAGASSIDMGDGPGVFTFNFIVEETNGTPNRRVEKLVTATVRIPAEIVDNFEYPASASTLAANKWYKLQGTGSMQLIQEDSNDPNSNHYLKTSVTGTPSNNSQLDFIVYKTITDSNLFNNAFPVIEFSINDKNLYYFDAFVRGKNNAGAEANYFLRYIPQGPIDVAKVSSNYVRTNIGTGSINVDPNIITVVSRNMETDLYNATGFHYLYLKGIVLRGDINHLDDIKVRSGGPMPQILDVTGLTAQGNENQVTLTWTVPEGQPDIVAGYKIYRNEGVAPTKDVGYLIYTASPSQRSYTDTGRTNNVTYYYLLTTIDNLLTPRETNGKYTNATPNVTIPLDPIELAATQINNMIQLTWKNDANQHPDLAGYMVYYCDCSSNDCDCPCSGELVAANKADSNGMFTHYINKDASQSPLQFGTKYYFTVKAKDTAQPANCSTGEQVSIKLEIPATKVIDNFEYEAGVTLSQKGWYRLQGNGSFKLKLDPGGVNHYLEVKSSSTGSAALDYMNVKWLKTPTDFTNPNFSAYVRSLGNFRIVAYVKGKDGNNYFMVYKGNANTDQDSTDFVVENKRFFVYTIGWQNKASTTEWYPLERNLDDDLIHAKGVGFDMVLGVILQGTLDIDNLELGEGVLDVENLTLRPGDSSVLLSYTVSDPNKIDETLIYVDDNLLADTNIVQIAPDKNDYMYQVTGLTNDTTYEFKVVQVAGEDQSKGVSANATPTVYKTDSLTFDDSTALDDWSEPADGVSFEVVYDSGVQSNVMHLDPDKDYPDRYYVSRSIDVSDVTGMTCNIKANSNFVIWLKIVDTGNDEFLLGFVPGGTSGNHIRFGNFAYIYLGPLANNVWHNLDFNLDDVMDSIFTGVGTDNVKEIYFGGSIYVDDVSFY